LNLTRGRLGIPNRFNQPVKCSKPRSFCSQRRTDVLKGGGPRIDLSIDRSPTRDVAMLAAVSQLASKSR
jgi:hypothetical protein